MKKVAIIQLGTLDVQLTIGEILENQTFMVLDKAKENIKITEEFENDTTIGATKFNEIMFSINHFKALIDSMNVEDVYCFADNEYSKIKNEQSFFEQITSKTNYRFVLLPEKTEIELIYNAVVNSIDITKGVFLNVGEYKSYLVQYNRRVIVNFSVIPFGVCSLNLELKDIEQEQKLNIVMEKMKEALASLEWLNFLPEDLQIVGTGNIFVNISKLCRLQEKYPLDKDHNFIVKSETLNKIFETVKAVPVDAGKKLKGTTERADIMIIGIAIVKALMDNTNFKSMITSSQSVPEGHMFALINPLSPCKPATDSLEFSLTAINHFFGASENTEQVTKLSIALFRQLRVVHGLNRNYLTSLRIASKLYDCGKRITCLDWEKLGYHALINSPIFGAGHKEIILAGFILLYQNNDDKNNLIEWSKYRSVLTDEDLLAVKKLAVLLKLAKAFDKYSNSKVVDITCDILGECVIMKTVMTQINSLLEIREARKVETDFKRIFQRNIQIL